MFLWDLSEKLANILREEGSALFCPWMICWRREFLVLVLCFEFTAEVAITATDVVMETDRVNSSKSSDMMFQLSKT